MNKDFKALGAAPTLSELRRLIDVAIAEVGPDATWNGFDDGALYIYGHRWLSIANEAPRRVVVPA